MPKVLLVLFISLPLVLLLILTFSKNKPLNLEDSIDDVFSKLNIHIKSNTDENPLTSLLKEKTYDIPIITYHYVEIVKNKDDFIRERLSIKPATFEYQLQTLKNKNYTTIWVKEIPIFLLSSKSQDSKMVALTFDDAYGDFYTDVFPILKKYKAKATVYVISSFIDRPNYMTKQQLKEVIDSGLVEIGSHSISHLDLPSVSSEVAKYQITQSRLDLENTYGVKVETFCYPYGFYNQNIIDMVKDAGYKAAVSEDLGTIQSKDNLFKLSRVRVGGFDTIIK